MEFVFEQIGAVGIFIFKGELTEENEDSLKIVLMKAIHSLDRAVLNFEKVKRIDLKCLSLIKQAYFTSVRLRNPLILTNMTEKHLSEMFEKNNDYSFAAHNPKKDTEKFIYH